MKEPLNLNTHLYLLLTKETHTQQRYKLMNVGKACWVAKVADSKNKLQASTERYRNVKL